MSFSGTIKCKDCGTIYHKGQDHVCPYLCDECGVKVYAHSAHICDPKKVEEVLVTKFKDELRGGELTPRMKKHLAFLEWCRENDRP